VDCSLGGLGLVLVVLDVQAAHRLVDRLQDGGPVLGEQV